MIAILTQMKNFIGRMVISYPFTRAYETNSVNKEIAQKGLL